MSFKAYQWAWEQSLPHTEKIVLLYLVKCAQQKTFCYPSIRVIADATGMSKSTVSRQLNKLEQKGFLIRQQRQHKNDSCLSNFYQIPIPTVEMSSPTVNPSPIAAMPMGFTQDDQAVYSGCDTREGINEDINEDINEKNKKTKAKKKSQTNLCEVVLLKKNNLSAQAANTEAMSVIARRVFAYWQQVMNHSQAKLDDKRKGKLIQAIKLGYTEKQMQQAIDGCKRSAFHQGKNDRGRCFDDIELIFRDAKHIEDFINHRTRSSISTMRYERPDSSMFVGVL